MWPRFKPRRPHCAALARSCHAPGYEALVRELYQVNMFSPCKLGLENVQRLHDLSGAPSARFHAVHVAGTNGKGSVSWKLAKASRVLLSAAAKQNTAPAVEFPRSVAAR